jgi:hypothetical protein
MACKPYCVRHHDFAIMDISIIVCLAKGDKCGDDMIALEGSESSVDVFGLAGHYVRHL